MTKAERRAALNALALDRILILDGAMGTQIQTLKLDEAGYRGERFADWSCLIQGNNDILNLSKPDAVRAIHKQYFDAGADMVETNTFSATRIAQGGAGRDRADQQDAVPVAECGRPRLSRSDL